MNLGEILSGFFRDVAVALGFVAVIQVAFAPAIVERTAETLTVESRLEGAVTGDLEQLIRGSAPIVIRYEGVLYFGRSGRTSVTLESRLRYRGIDDSYEVVHSGPDERSLVLHPDLGSAVVDLTTFRRTWRIRDPQLLTLEASLAVPGVEQDLVDRLWAGRTPALRLRF